MNQFFLGFGSESFAFFQELARNNNKAWFDRNRDRYEAHVTGAFRALLAQLEPFLLRLNPHFETGGKTNRSFSRINRDIRFSKDKSPYKPNFYLYVFDRRRDRDKDGRLYFSQAGCCPPGSSQRPGLENRDWQAPRCLLVSPGEKAVGIAPGSAQARRGLAEPPRVGGSQGVSTQRPPPWQAPIRGGGRENLRGALPALCVHFDPRAALAGPDEKARRPLGRHGGSPTEGGRYGVRLTPATLCFSVPIRSAGISLGILIRPASGGRCPRLLYRRSRSPNRALPEQ